MNPPCSKRPNGAVGRSLRSLVALASLALLPACGGGGSSTPPATYTIGGTVSGLGSGLSVVLKDNGGDSLTISSNGTLTFATAIASGTAYAVTVGTQPSGQNCAVANGSGTVGSTNVTNVAISCAMVNATASLTGTWVVADELAFARATGLSTLTLDGAGNCSGSEIINNGASFTTSSVAGTYALAASGALTYDCRGKGAQDGGILGTDGSAFVALNTAAGGNPDMVVGVKPVASGASAASLSGKYTYVGLEIETTAPFSLGVVSSVNFNGTTSYDTTSTVNAYGVVQVANPVLATPYTVSAAGVVSLNSGQLTGAISGNGDLTAVTVSGGAAYPAHLGVFVKQGSGESLATLNGNYTAVHYTNGTGVATGTLYTIAFDGKGTYTATYLRNSAGTASNSSTSGTYTVASDGAVTLTEASSPPLTGAVSQDGYVFAVGQVSNGNSPAMMVGVHK